MILELGKSYERNDGKKVTMEALPQGRAPSHLSKAAFWVSGVGYYDKDGTYSGMYNSKYSIKAPLLTPVEAAKKLLEEEGFVVKPPAFDTKQVQTLLAGMFTITSSQVYFAGHPITFQEVDKLTAAVKEAREYNAKWKGQ
jgi:hypothetical protein